MTFGKSDHGVAKHYVGCIHKAMFGYDDAINTFVKNSFVKIASFYTSDETLEISVVGSGKIDHVEVNVKR